MEAARILSIVISFVGVAVAVLLLGQLGADYVLKGAAASSSADMNAAPFYAMGWMFTKFIISPIAAIVCGAVAAWKVAKSNVVLW
jgi:hypothetical protein